MPKSTAARVRKHRSALRTAGFRPIQIWVPDARKKGFRKECHRQSLLLQKDLQERDILKWIASISDHKGWT